MTPHVSKLRRELAVTAGGRRPMTPAADRLRAVAAVLLGALAFAVFLVAAYATRPPVVIKMDADLRGLTRGFYPVERTERFTPYAWTRSQAELSLPGLDRRMDWQWTDRVIISRPPGVPPAHVRIAVDGIAALERTIRQDFERLEVMVPRRPGKTGVTLTLDTVPTFVPGPEDSRELGIALESMSLEPAGGRPLPPPRALVGGTLAVLALGAALVALGLPVTWVMGCAMLAAVGQTWLITRGVAAYAAYPLRIAAVAFWLGVGTLFVVRVLEKIRRERIGTTARAVVAFSTMACYLKLLILLHPDMPIGDGVFHAHRLLYVLTGRFYFTSLAPGGHAFPYPILLYVFAAPFSFLAPETLDRVALLRIIVTAADAAAGAMLYWMVVRTSADRLAAVSTVVWYHIVPATAWIMTWGNLTNAFGQALFVTSLVAVVAVPVEWTRPRTVALLAVLASAAFLAHPSTCAILATLLVVTAVLYRWRGGQDLQAATRGVWVAALVAAAVAFVLYYAWFPAVYLTEISRVASATATRAAEPGSSLETRLASIPILANSYFGWPAIVAAAVGIWRLWQGTEPLRLTLLLLGWAGACFIFLGVGLLSPVEMRYHFAAFPAVALAAAYGWIWAWRSRLPLRVFAMLVLVAATWVGLQQWIAMLV